jgi:hypothetical protein
LPRISAPHKDSTPNPDGAQIAAFSFCQSPTILANPGPKLALLAINLTFPFFAQTMQNINMCGSAPFDSGGAI